MTKRVFLLKVNEDDRDCVKYLGLDTGTFECDHYFAGLRIGGACFSGFGFANLLKEMECEDYTTILTKEELQRLFDFDTKITALKYGIVKGDERYMEGLRIKEEIADIFAKLQGEENQQLFMQVQEEEKEFLKEEYNLDDADIELIFNEYCLDYRDRGIVSRVYSDIDECAREEAEGLGHVTESNERYFNFESFGEDLLEGDSYLELADGRIVYLNY